MSAAERKRRERERERNGEAVYTVQLDEVAISDLLVRTGLLQPWSVESKDVVTRALEAYLHHASRVTSGQAM
jgi:hypothetical protein